MRKIAAFLFLVHMGFAAITASAREVIACGHHDYPPWNWAKDEEIVGACVDVAKRAFAQLGHTLNMRYVGPWVRCQRLVESGEVDVNICATKNAERQRYSEFTHVPMGVNLVSVFTRNGKEFPFDKWDDLAGRNIGKINGVSMGPEFDDFLSHKTTATLANTAQSMWLMLAADRMDAAVMGRAAGLLQLRQFGLTSKISPLPKEALKVELYISVSKKSADLVAQLPLIDQFLLRKGYAEELDQILIKANAAYP